MAKLNVERNWVRERCIGRGSFATVSLAVRKEDGGVFAVKSVDVDAASCSFSQVEALENEIRILRSISSPYVVNYIGDDVTWEGPTTSCRNLHLEYLPGGTVADLAKRRGGDVDEEVVRSYTRCVVEALRYIHSRGIVHCDVKGRNVLVGPSAGFAKLADFGSAVEIGSKPRGNKVPPRGSPLWMAPEVIRGEYQGPESDVWSLGCTIIEMITGKWPWEDRGTADTLCRIGYSDELPQFPAQLSELGCDFLGKCLQRDLTKRWSCDQLLRHPFISMFPPPDSLTAYSSPRCVLDWFNSDFDSDTDSVGDSDDISGTVNFTVKQRIGKLASGMSSEWPETDGWVVVRGGGGEEGTSSEYQNLIRTERERCSVYSDSVGISASETSTSKECLSPEFHGDGYCHGVVRPRSPHGSPVPRRAGRGGDDSHVYSCSDTVLLMTLFFNFYRCICTIFILSCFYPICKKLLFWTNTIFTLQLSKLSPISNF